MNVGTIGAVNDDAAAAGGIADDFIAGNGRAAAREPNEKSGLSVYEHAARRAASAVPRMHLERLGHFPLIEVYQLEQHLIDGYGTVPHGREHFVAGTEGIAFGNAFETFVRKESGEGISSFFRFFFQPCLPDTDIVLFELVFIELFDFSLCAG